MIWKTIGQSVIGTSHKSLNKGCEDSIRHNKINLRGDEEVLICAISDGAGSAKYAAESSKYVTEEAVEKISSLISLKDEITQADIISIIEDLYIELKNKASDKNELLNEFSCTLLGCVLFPSKAIFFQIGDGAIVRDDGLGYYINLWWPQNGEYLNTTSFLIDDENLSNLRILEVNEPINEIAVFSDGLQLLTLNMEGMNVHQPFFQNMFRWLRLANDTSKLAVLEEKLCSYLSSDLINSRTDDDKTLFLATRLKNDWSDI